MIGIYLVVQAALNISSSNYDIIGSGLSHDLKSHYFLIPTIHLKTANKVAFLAFSFLLYSSLCLRSSLFHRSNIYFNSELRAGLDYEFYSRCLQASLVSNCRDALVTYSQNVPNGITKSPDTRKIQLDVHYNVLLSLLGGIEFRHKPVVQYLFQRFVLGQAAVTLPSHMHVHDFLSDIISPSSGINYFPAFIQKNHIHKYFQSLLLTLP